MIWDPRSQSVSTAADRKRRAVLESVITGGLGLTLLTTAWLLTPPESNYPGATLILLASNGLILSAYSVLRMLWFVATVLFRESRTGAPAKEKGMRSSAAPLVAPAANHMAAHDIVVGGRFIRAVALLLPRGHRKGWIKDVVYSTTTKYGERLRVVLVRILGHTVKYPITVISSWMEVLGVTTQTVHGLRVHAGKFIQVVGDGSHATLVRLKTSVASWWREWWMAIVFAVLAAILMEPVMHIVTYMLHHAGYEYLWEKYFPLD